MLTPPRFRGLRDDVNDAGLTCNSYRAGGATDTDPGDYRRSFAWHAACETDGSTEHAPSCDGETVTRLRYGVRKE